MGSSQTAVDYRADALLYFAFGKFGLSNSDVQYAIWSIFDPAVTSNSAFTSTSQTLVNLALQYAVDPGLINSGFFQNFSLYTPTSDQTGWTAGIPQEFIGTAVTPEPSAGIGGCRSHFQELTATARRATRGTPGVENKLASQASRRLGHKICRNDQ